jgi:2,3-dihydroxybenzoate decarboxylase
VAKHPDRFAAFAALSMHDPNQAADELRRAVKELGLLGAMLNDFQSAGEDGNVTFSISTPSRTSVLTDWDSQTMLMYDDPVYDVSCAKLAKERVGKTFSLTSSLCQPFWAAVQELDVPVYLHPRLASPRVWKDLYGPRKWLEASAWGFANQLSIHILGIITGGVFDRFPKVRLGPSFPFFCMKNTEPSLMSYGPKVQMIFGHMGELSN